MALTVQMPIIEKKFGTKQLRLDTGLINPPLMRLIADKIGTISGAESAHEKYPMQIGETENQWVERLAKAGVDAEGIARRADESPEAHVTRIYAPKLRKVTHGLAIINAIMSLTGGEQLTEDEYDKNAWIETSSFLYNVLTFCACDEAAKAYAPKSVI